MKHIWLLLILLGTCAAQSYGHVDWKPCEDLLKTFKARVDKFNERTDGLKIDINCVYGGDPTRRHKPEQRVELTPNEILHLHELRRAEDSAYSMMGDYENYLFRAHHIHKPEISDPCYYFVGFVVDQDYITIDPNSVDPFCNEEINP